MANTPFSEMHDILLGYDTDLHFENGDLMVTSGIDYIEREVYKLLITLPGDWKSTPQMGASPNKFTGEPNTREIGQAIERHIKRGIQEFIFPAQVYVKVVPVDYDKVIGFVDLYTLDTKISRIPFEFDYVNGFRKVDSIDERVTQELSDRNTKINNIENQKRPNKYWSRFKDSINR